MLALFSKGDILILFVPIALNSLDVLTPFCGRLAMLDEHRPPEMLRRGHYVELICEVKLKVHFE